MKNLQNSGYVIWLTGLSGSGKSTIAQQLVKDLKSSHRTAERGIKVLDGDEVREHLNSDLGFSKADRDENIKRISYAAKCVADAGGVAIVAAISPYAEARGKARQLIGDYRFIEVHVATPLETCEARDVKGLYKKARAGEIKEFTGISDPYEAPESPEVTVTTDCFVEDASSKIFEYVVKHVDHHTYALYIGRWQPFHKGHENIIRRSLDNHENVLIGVRATPTDESNPLTTAEVTECIEQVFAQEIYEGSVRIMTMPDIHAVCIGRKVGYEVRRFDPPENIKAISATKIRALIKAGDINWREYVSEALWGILPNLLK